MVSKKKEPKISQIYEIDDGKLNRKKENAPDAAEEFLWHSTPTAARAGNAVLPNLFTKIKRNNLLV